MGSARTGDLAAADRELNKLKELRATLEKANQSYWAEQVEIQALAASAWIAHAEGQKDKALKFMRAAADLEDNSAKHVAIEFSTSERPKENLVGYKGHINRIDAVDSHRWVRGGIENPTRLEKIPVDLPHGVRLDDAPEGTTISALLERGEIDGFIAPRPPSLVQRGHPHVGWLFPDPVAVAKDYFERTGIFPIMHVVAKLRTTAPAVKIREQSCSFT